MVLIDNESLAYRMNQSAMSHHKKYSSHRANCFIADDGHRPIHCGRRPQAYIEIDLYHILYKLFWNHFGSSIYFVLLIEAQASLDC